MAAKIFCYIGLACLFFNFPQETPTPYQSISTQPLEQPKAHRLVRLALKEIKNNCNPGPYRLNGYYRQYSLDSVKYFNYLEATVSKYDFGYNVGNHKSRYSLHQARFHPAYQQSPDEKPVTGGFEWLGYRRYTRPQLSPYKNELTILMFLDPIRNYKKQYFRSLNLLYLDFSSFHVFTIEREDENSYTIKIGPSGYLMDLRYEVKGMMKISKDGYAIQEFTYWFKSRGIENEVVIKYSKYQTFWYPKYLGFSEHTSYQEITFDHYQEFFLEDVSVGNVKIIPKQEMMDLRKSMVEIPFTEVSNYWEEYRFNQNKPLVKKQ